MNDIRAVPANPTQSGRVSTPSGSPFRDGIWEEPPEKFSCPVCKDRLWVVHDVQRGHPKFGKAVRCPECGERSQQESLQKRCGLTPEMKGWTFANTKRAEGNAAAYDAAQQLASKPQRFLTLYGGYGMGKTRLMACIVNDAMSAGLTAVYTTTADVLDHLRAAYGPKAETSCDERLERLTNARVLCLDEFDRFHSTEWAQEKLFQLIDARHRRGHDHLTCFAANRAPEDLPAYIQSRLEDSQCRVFELAGSDVRRRTRP